jgi:hypothetical protein
MRHKTAYRTTQLLSQGPRYRDELITLGLYRSNPCRHPLRMVSVLWAGQWYRYLTNVLDPQGLSARPVCELYRRRWCIEEAFLLTKRVLDLAYLSSPCLPTIEGDQPGFSAARCPYPAGTPAGLLACSTHTL